MSSQTVWSGIGLADSPSKIAAVTAALNRICPNRMRLYCSCYIRLLRYFSVLVLMLASIAFGESAAWVAKSNQNAQVLLEIEARFNPESAGASGINGLDEQI